MALAVSYAVFGDAFTLDAAGWFIAFSMVALAMLKLQDIESFSTMLLNYDLLARRWVRYSYIYPFAEAGAGLLMIAGALDWLSIPVALFIGTVGAVSVIKAVYIDRRELKCACVGGGSNVPLGFVSLAENLMMVAMALWMLWMLAMPPAEEAEPDDSAQAAPAIAEPGMPGMAMRHANPLTAAQQAYMAGMDRMNRDMAAPMGGDADKDFVAMMIPHHQGAIDMAKVQLQYGRDPQLRAMSEGIVKAQEAEIADMRQWQSNN